MRYCRVSKKRSRSNFHSLTLNLLFSVDIFTKTIKKKEEEKIKLSSRSSTIIQPFFNIHVTLYPSSIELPLPLIRDYFSKIFTPSPKERRCNSRVKKNWSTTRLRFETYTRDYLFSIPSRRTFFLFHLLRLHYGLLSLSTRCQHDGGSANFNKGLIYIEYERKKSL